MKKLKLDARKLQLKKEKIAELTKDQMGNVLGGQPITTATKTTCCVVPPTNTCVTNYCTGSCPNNCATGEECEVTGENCNVQ